MRWGCRARLLLVSLVVVSLILGSPLVALARGGGGKGGSYGKPSVSGGSYGKPSSGRSSSSYTLPPSSKSSSSTGRSSVGGMNQTKPGSGSGGGEAAPPLAENQGSGFRPLPVPMPIPVPFSFRPFIGPGFVWGYDGVGNLLGPGYFLGRVLSVLPAILFLLIAWRIARHVFRR